MKKIITILLSAMMLFSCAACGGKPTYEKREFSKPGVRAAARADQLARAVLDKHISKGSYDEPRESEDWEVLLYENYDVFGDSASKPASAWHYTSVVAMTNRLLAINADNKTNKDFYSVYNKDLIDEFAWYKGTGAVTSYKGTKSETLYAVKRASDRGQASIADVAAVYDDQMWMIRELINAYENTGKKEYLDEAERLTIACLNGAENTYRLIPWGPGYWSFHTCSNAPIIKPLVQLSNLYKDKTDSITFQTSHELTSVETTTKEAFYLAWAEDIYKNTKVHLMNGDYTFGDAFWTEKRDELRTLEEGGDYRVTTKKNNTDDKRYTYNTGAMISGAAYLYEATENEEYLKDARVSAAAASHIFTYDTDKGIKNLPSTSTVWFNLVLLTGFMDLYPHAKTEVAPYIDTYEKALDYSYEHYYYKGFLPRNYIDGWVKGSKFDSLKDVMDSAANAEMYAMLAQFHNGK